MSSPTRCAAPGAASGLRCQLLAVLAGLACTLAAMPGSASAATLADAAKAPAAGRFSFASTPGVLSKAVRPTLYRLMLDLDPARDEFSGEVRITLNLASTQAQLELHAHELQLLEARLDSVAGARMLDAVPDAARQTWRLQPRDGQPVPAGRQQLVLRYRGVVHAQGLGLYQTALPGGTPGERMLATQLEAIHARQLFPCFDEPVFRTPVQLSVRAPRGLEVLSNMPRRERHVEADGTHELHVFPPTPAMPSYLVAVAVGRFDVLEGRAAGVPLRILTAPGKREQARYAMQVTERVLPEYTRYFGVPYALPRLDQLAVPGTRRGAMEDWGLISYAESTLLFDPARTSPAAQRWIYNIIAHEVSHQWFGNLVTAASWSEIWLNEAFATWMAHKVTDRHNPAWQLSLNDRLQIDETLDGDAGAATRAIRSGPVTEQRVWDVFDDITYTKGGAVLAMLEQWLGEATFQRGLAAYMRERRLSNATAADLWHHMGRAAGRDVQAVAHSWTDQPGFPLVSVASRCEGGRTVVELSQRRFGADAATPGARWQIPLRLTRGSQTVTHLLKDAQDRVSLAGCSTQPLVANAGGVGYYRIAYDEAQRRALLSSLAALSPADRLTLLTDTAALSRAGQVPAADLAQALGAVPALPEPGRAALWRITLGLLEEYDRVLVGHPAQAALRGALRRLAGPELARLGWQPRDGEDDEAIALRADLIHQLGMADDREVIARAQALVDAAEAGSPPLPPSLRGVLTRTAARQADALRLERLRERLRTATSEEDRRIYARALTSGRTAEQATALLDWALETGLPTNVTSDLPQMLAELSGQIEPAYAHVLAHWSRWQQVAGPEGSRWLLPGVAWKSADAALAERLLADQARLLGPGEIGQAAPADRAAAQVRQRALQRTRDAAALNTAFEQLAR